MARWRLVVVVLVALALAVPAAIAQDQPGTGEPGPDQRKEKPPPGGDLDPEDVDERLEVLGTVADGLIVITRPDGSRVILDEDRDDRDQRDDIPFGSTIDATRGQLRIGKSKKATRFYGGRFKLIKGKRVAINGRKRRVNEVALVGALSCPSRGRAAAAAGKRKRRLWGSGQGSFKTQGKHAAATVRGTKWLVEDTCAGTRVTVVSGAVSVYDKVRKTRRTLRKGESVLIPPPRRG